MWVPLQSLQVVRYLIVILCRKNWDHELSVLLQAFLHTLQHAGRTDLLFWLQSLGAHLCFPGQNCRILRGVSNAHLILLIWLYWVVEETWQSCHCWGRIWMCHAAAVLLFSSEFYKLCVQSITQYCGVNGAIVVTQEFIQARPELFWGYGIGRVDQQAHCLPGEMHTLIRQLESGGEWEESIH